jgi:hypothetical protein
VADDPDIPLTELDRRSVLKAFAAGGLAVTVAQHRIPSGLRSMLAITAASTPSLSVNVFRRDDLFDLRFDFFNLVFAPGPPPVLKRQTAGATAYVVVGFPMQHIGEQAVQVGASPPPPPWPSAPLGAYAAGPTQLVFMLPKSVASIPFTLQGLLGWTSWTPKLTSAAAIISAKAAGPGQLDTFVEAPWSLFLSPDSTGTWHHAAAPNTHGQWTELWQTRLGKAALEPPAVKPSITAVWAPSYPSLGPANPFPMPLQNTDRRDIVSLTSGGVNANGQPFPALPIPANLFMLTPLGASMDLDGRWNQPTVSSLIEWRQRMTTGRDSYVRIVRAGFIYPFGHKAVWITISQREFAVDSAGGITAYLVQKQYVEITETSKTYPGASPEPFSGRENPFRTIVAVTTVTPPLDPPVFIPTAFANGAFWPIASGAPVAFSFAGLDVEGRRVNFTTNGIWVDEQAAFDFTTSVPNVENEYSAAANTNRRSPALGGQLLAMAPPGTSGPGATAHHADSIVFDGHPVNNAGQFKPAWFPVVASATLRIPAAEQVTGGQLPGPAPVFAYATQYLNNGFQNHIPEVFLMAQGAGTALTFPADKAGGMATPNFMINGLSRQHGPVADAANLLGGTFNPATYFAGLEAKILGGLDLFQIIESLAGNALTGKLPEIKSTLVFPGGNTSLAPTGLQTTVDWTPNATADPTGTFDPQGDLTKTLSINVKIFVPFDNPAGVTSQIQGQLVDFDLNLFGKPDDGGLTFLNLHFNKMTLDAKTGSKTQFTVDIASVNFVGPLSFIAELEQFFASLGGPSIDIQPSGLTVAYSLPLPSISVGVFALENIALGGELDLPFDGSPVRLKVNFCTRENPFLLTIYLFTGGGFFGIALGTDGIELIEVSLEFGASISMDLGVASGGVSIMAGIYFSLAKNTDPSPAEIVTLTGFLQASGNLEVLGIISISIVFYLGFTYQSPGKCTGTASVMVTVKVLFFSASVTLTVTKTFGGSGDPTFAQALTQSDWSTYCAAFA